MKKLNLNKETIASLDNKAMEKVKGGFTYSASLGAVCRHSKGNTARNAYECGMHDAIKEQ